MDELSALRQMSRKLDEMEAGTQYLTALLTAILIDHPQIFDKKTGAVKVKRSSFERRAAEHAVEVKSMKTQLRVHLTERREQGE